MIEGEQHWVFVGGAWHKGTVPGSSPPEPYRLTIGVWSYHRRSARIDYGPIAIDDTPPSSWPVRHPYQRAWDDYHAFMQDLHSLPRDLPS